MPDPVTLTPELNIPESQEDFEKLRNSGKVPEPKAATKSEAPAEKKESDKKETAGESQRAPESDPDDHQEPEEGEPGKKKIGGWQRRVNRLTRENGILTGRLQALEQQVAARSAKPQESATQFPVDPKDPEPDPNDSKFKTYEDYIKALGAWSSRQELKQSKARESQQKQAEQKQARETSWGEKLQKAQEAHEDWDEVFDGLDIPISEAIEEAIQESEHGTELLYRLGKNPDQAKRIAALSPIAAARELGKIEAQIVAEQKAKTPETKTKKSSEPPPEPITPVTGTKGMSSILLDDKADFADWEKARNAQLAGK